MSVVKSINHLIVDLKENKNFNANHISNGRDTFDDLYRREMYLTAAIANSNKDISWKSKKHQNGSDMFNGNGFIIGIETPEGTYTHSYKIAYWDLFDIPELDQAKPTDGNRAKGLKCLLKLSK